MEEVRDHHRNLGVAYYDYKKTYMVHHDWMLRVYEWMGIDRKLQNVIKEVTKEYKTCQEVRKGGKLLRSQYVDIKKRVCQGDTYSPVRFCCTEIPVMTLLEESHGYKIDPPAKREILNTHSLSIDGLKTYQ